MTRDEEEVPEVHWFFVHVMKTVGGTLNQHLHANFGPGEVYPDPRVDDDMGTRYYSVEQLLALPEDRVAQVRLYKGHFPYATVDRLGLDDVVTMTMLRDPVERVLSYLRRRQELREPELSLEEIYAIPKVLLHFVHNHQVRMFARTAEDPPVYHWWIEIDDERMAIAKTNLANVDIVGLTERFDEFLDMLRQRWGWTISSVENQHVTTPVEVSPEFRDRIARDNAADMEFYEFAKALYRERQGSPPA